MVFFYLIFISVQIIISINTIIINWKIIDICISGFHLVWRGGLGGISPLLEKLACPPLCLPHCSLFPTIRNIIMQTLAIFIQLLTKIYSIFFSAVNVLQALKSNVSLQVWLALGHTKILLCMRWCATSIFLFLKFYNFDKGIICICSIFKKLKVRPMFSNVTYKLFKITFNKTMYRK